MTERDRNSQRRASLIAALVTFGSALVILVLLFVLNIGGSRQVLAEVSTPEVQDDEEIFLEPEFLTQDVLGEQEAEEIDEAAPQTPGEPDRADEDQPVRVVPNEKEPQQPPVSNKPELVSSKEDKSDLKTSTPKLSKEEEQRIAAVSGKLKTDNNGSRTGKESGESGAGGEGISTVGSLKGRKMISCNTWKVRLTQKTVVKVSITVNAEGNVTKATAVSGGTPNLRTQCEKMAMTSKWDKKAGAAPASGTITFTISPN